MRNIALLGLLLGLGLVSAAGCRTVRAAAPVELPNLEVPPPPPRVIEPAPVTEPPQPEPVGELPAVSAMPKPRPQRDGGSAAKPEAKPEAPPEPPPATPTAPAPQLRAPGLASGPETAGAIRAILERAISTLNVIDYGKLSKTHRENYDSAKRFAEEGEKELKAANYVLAKELAEKADRLAKGIQSSR
jgi:hypothetical protein